LVKVRRVYLDQNKWIDLARAVTGDASGERFTDARLVLKAGIESGQVSLPLSSAHYMETQHRRDWRSRRDLAETMIAFSKLHAIAPQEQLLPGEIDVALGTLFGVPETPRIVRPFGTGVSHAFGMPIGPYRIPDELREYVDDPVSFERSASRLLEQHLLIGPSPKAEKEGIPDYDPFSHLQVGERYAKAKEDLREVRKEHGWYKGERLARASMVQALTDHLPVIEEAMSRAGLAFHALLAQGQNGMSTFVNSVPTMLASAELEKQRHSSSQKAWERQDLTDIGALLVALVHCDVVVTERFWSSAARRSRLDQKFGTIVIPRLDELPERLLALG
jgi:hypothetical protein